MGISVAVADMNGDGLPDIVTMDALGYLRIYFNSGTKQQPKFTIGELVPVYLSRMPPGNWAEPDYDQGKEHPYVVPYMRLAPRIAVAAMTDPGKEDIVMGDYAGEILLLPNVGSNLKPQFDQPSDVNQLLIPTASNPAKKWGNILSPCVWDWHTHGKPDLLLGEGSYSANNVHLLVNQSSVGAPAYNENAHYMLAYGDGRRQLNPCVVDYKGRGLPDLLVSESSGKIGLYLNRGGAWKPGDDLPFDSDLCVNGNAGDPISFGGVCTVATGDFKGSGLFDIIVGQSSGRVARVENTGKKGQPVFSAPMDLTGDNSAPSINTPSGWNIDYGLGRGNFYAFASVVSAKDDPLAQTQDGKQCLKFGYFPSKNKVLPAPLPSQYGRGSNTFNPFLSTGSIVDVDPGIHTDIVSTAPANYFAMSIYCKMDAEKDYTLTFKAKGNQVTGGKVYFQWRGDKLVGQDKVIHGDRGSAVVLQDVVHEEGSLTTDFGTSSQWSEVSMDFKMHFKQRPLRDLKDIPVLLQIAFSLEPGAGVLYVENIEIKENVDN